ncbi:flagellar hook-associated protein FlgL [Aquincola tertiaricarbonis]|uniref:Flagellar hook-associated protein FlgL n=1 Tax=Aquincola tertiaricarbonis TaxID=391953 RepID=A0ABY4S0D8_AQUTE|nr:flagellar hook-associated protein FlgL [Aquincola tertiaricarbonis]URI06244.1 flagellar hook-associated protein FlgL [Aquincola tertiaricarbonis]
MRIASTQYHSTMNAALQDASARAQEMLERIASGNKLSVPSDDPVTAVRLSRLTREEAALDQYRENITALGTRLQQNEALLDGMSTDLLQVRDLLVWGADGGNTPEDVAAMAGSLKALRDSLFYTANSRDQEGRYMFSGTATNTATITADSTQPVGSRYSWTGNAGEQKVVVGNGITQTANVHLDQMAALLNQLDRTISSFESGVSVNDTTVRAELTATMSAVDGGIDKISTLIAGLGGAQNTLQTLGDNHANVSLSNQQAGLTLGALDYSEAAVKLEGYSTALEATQKAYAKVSGLSLFDVI